LATTVAKDSNTGAAYMPSGTTAQRPVSPVNGYMRYNSDLLAMEAYVNGAWGAVGSDVATQTHAATSKATPVDADEIPIMDSASTFSLKKLTWANLKATIKTYFDGIYANLVSPTLSGTPTAPTAGSGTNTTQLATTAFVQGAQAVLQTTYAELTTTGTGTNTIPYDATIPQITEGNEILTCTITPKSSTSSLLIFVSTFIGEVANNGNYPCAALFRDATVDAVSAMTDYAVNGNNGISACDINMICKIPSTATVSTTIRLRVGMDIGTIRWNGAVSTQYYGTAQKTTITIMEVL
jgi:hypothetical protein